MNRWVRRSGFYLGLSILCFWLAGPVIWQFITSLKSNAILTSLPPVLPDKIVFSHYTNVFTERPFARIILNSFIVASCTTIYCLAIGLLAGTSLSILKFKWRKTFLAIVLSVSMFPPIATVSPLYLIIRAIGLRDTYLALIFPYATFALPLSIWILTNFIAEIPSELYKAARIDGCSPMQALFKVIFPLAAPGVFTCAILVFIFAWNEFLYALTFTTTTNSRTIPVAIALFPGLHEVPWGEIAAASIIVTLPLVVLVFFAQKRIISGLTAGSIKG
ncbi:MAG: ABC transporter permease subunit [candidate division Zixibacteria bacterium]|nr:ABC transporter permease subunit [candidate division Zixibacteria bacterium]